MKEIPILFSTPMVQAIIADRKTETRRTSGLDEINKNPDDWEIDYVGKYWTNSKGYQVECLWISFGDPKKDITQNINIKCPYGKPGDLLWVRETFVDIHDQTNSWLYKADEMFNGMETFDWKWKPSIHMPKAAARIWLKVIDIKVERLHNITEESAISEGVLKRNNDEFWDYINGFFRKDILPTYSFKSLWKYINGEESWKANPWIWVVKFKVVSKNGKPIDYV